MDSTTLLDLARGLESITLALSGRAAPGSPTLDAALIELVAMRAGALLQEYCDPKRRVGASATLAGQRALSSAGRVRRVQEFIACAYGEPLTTRELAAVAACSREYLAKTFRLHTGLTLRDYVTMVRIREAAALIAQGAKIDAVALLVGYRCKKNFFRQFRRHMKTTPMGYRRRLAVLAATTPGTPASVPDADAP